ncbi:hypothetical protein [Aequorivita sp. Q41]|uniref:helix-turn-helix transcriptional regulator n=1 Tax=Aequorivita sp. Q41 TaxID=3153300 RepID=UPI00324251BF
MNTNFSKYTRIRILIFGLLFSTFVVSGQNSDSIEDTKLEIKRLLDSHRIIETNDLIKKSSFLDIEYRLGVLNKNLALASQNNNPDVLASTYLTFGNFWHEQSNKVKAFDYYLNCESIAKKNNNHRLLGISKMNRSSLLDNNEDRIEMVKESIKAFEKAKDTHNLAKAHLNTGVGYGLFFNSIKLKDTLTNPELSKEVRYYKTNMFQHYRIAQSLGKSIKSNDVIATINIYYAEWHKYEGKLELAKALFEKGKNYSKLAGFYKGEVFCIKEIASIEKELGNKEAMWSLYALAEKMAKKNNYKDYLKEIYENYITIYAENDDYLKAFEYQKLLTHVNLDLVNSGNQDKLRILGLQNELSENAFQLEKVEAQQKFNKWLIVFSIFISIFIAVSAHLALKNRKRKMVLINNNNTITKLEKTAVEIELKNKKLEEELLKEKVRFGQEHLMLFANQVVKIENFMKLLKSKIKHLKYEEENQDIINDLKISFAEVTHGQNHLKQLNSYTSQLNQDFFFYINKQYENITKDDEQLLAYIILNMDSKEIGRILNITTDSVYKKRHRLRKKLNLTNENSFRDFYEQITSKISNG